MDPLHPTDARMMYQDFFHPTIITINCLLMKKQTMESPTEPVLPRKGSTFTAGERRNGDSPKGGG